MQPDFIFLVSDEAHDTEVLLEDVDALCNAGFPEFQRSIEMAPLEKGLRATDGSGTHTAMLEIVEKGMAVSA